MKRRLPPQPTDTRLARFVRRWPFAWAATVRERDKTIGRLQFDMMRQEQAMSGLERDLFEMMERHSPVVSPTFDAEISLDVMLQELRFSVRFDTLHFRMSEMEIRESYSPRGKELMRRIARRLAQHHADQFANMLTERFFLIEAKAKDA
jgi:hypothetical protein